MSDGNFLELKKQTLDHQFKTQQIQESVQLHRTMPPENAPVSGPMQKEKGDRAKKIKRTKKKGGILKKSEEVEAEELYGVTESEQKDTYARGRRDAFQEHLAEISAEHMALKNYDPEFKAIIRTIRRYVNTPEEHDRARGHIRTDARDMIRNYIASKEGAPELSAEETGALNMLNMYELWFKTFCDGNLEVPENAYRKDVVGADEPEFAKKNQGGLLAAKYRDVSREVLFPSEPSIEDIQQGGIGDCYLLSGLTSVVMSDPMAIKKAMRDNGKTVTVRFYETVRENKKDKGLRPVYITVNKTIPRSKWTNSEMYSKGALWVSMIEKAYAVWGGNQNEVTEKKQQELQESLLKEYLKQNMDKKTAEDLAERESIAAMKKGKGSYETIVSGDTAFFIQTFTGKEAMILEHIRMSTSKKVNNSLMKNVMKGVNQEMLNLLLINKVNVKSGEHQKAFERFTKEFGIAAGEKLLEMTEKHSAETMAVYEAFIEAFGNFSENFIKRFYDVDPKRELKSDEEILQKQAIYLDDVIEFLREEIKNVLYTRDGEKKFNIGEYDSVLTHVATRMLNRIEEAQDEHLETQGIERAREQFVHRSPGVYTKFAEAEYTNIQEMLKKGYHLNAASMRFAKGKGKGLNGESEDDGFVGGHGYTILGTQEMDGKKFIKLRNPWASGTLRYIRMPEQGGGKIEREMNESSSTDGIFFMELNEFIARTDEIKVNKEVAKNILQNEKV